MAERHTATPDSNAAPRILAVVREVAEELHPRRPALRTIHLDSTLDHDLGLDSLSRMELLARIERRLGVTFPERTFADAETVRDLLRAMSPVRTRRDDLGVRTVPDDVARGMEPVPHDARTLIDVLDWHARHHPTRTQIRLCGEDGEVESITYGGLMDRAASVAAGLVERGVRPGDAVAIMLPTCREYFLSLFGVMLAGGIAVPIYPPWRLAQLEEYVRRYRGVLSNCRASVLITFPEARPVARLLESQVETLRAVVDAEAIASEQRTRATPPLASEDVALLQYTSGSTGSPKGVVLTHANILANIRTMGEAVDVGPDDVFVSWLPLYHDMGLIGASLGTMYFGVVLVLMPPQSFLARPERWLRTIHRHRATISASPNFGYELCSRRVRDEQLEGVDLSCWRLAFNGAEPVSRATLDRFHERFRRYGFRREALTPVYGLAESSVGLAFPPWNRGPVFDRVDREAFARSGQAIAEERTDATALEFVACGQPLPGHEIRIVDPTGRELPERREGRLQFRGPSATSGYFRNPDDTRRLFDGEWLNSGDLAYVADGELYITGRTKDIIIRAGRNIHPSEIEEAVGELPGIRKGCVAVFGVPDPDAGTERLVVMAETREEDPTARQALTATINAAVSQLVQAPPDDVVLAPPHTVSKTSSGKIRRASSRERYLRGVGRSQRSVRWQIARVTLASVGPLLRSARRVAADWAYAFYAWTLFIVLTPAVWLSVVLLPRLRWRWAVARGAIRSLSRAVGTPISVDGLEKLPPPDRGCVLVANHASYLDGCALMAALPTGFSFVAKAELARNPLARVALRRLDTEFVERVDRQRGIEDTRSVARAARDGRSVLFFPEGTFDRTPGLQPFRMGAFVAAAEAGVPVVPVAIRGSRSVLRAYSWLPRRGAMRVTVGESIVTDEVEDPTAGDSWAVALRLRDAAREQILRHCGEPDLSRASGPPTRERSTVMP